MIRATGADGRWALAITLVAFLVTGCSEKSVEPQPHRPLWERSTPGEQGMDAVMLDSAFTLAEAAGYIDGLLVVRNGFIVAERYYNGYERSTPHNTMSVSKSFLSAVTGLALAGGYIDSLEEKVLDYFPEYVYPGIDTAKYGITLRHLLTMRMGIADESSNDFGEYWRLYNSDNWIKATIETPLSYQPGERMAYNTFQTHLLSGVITRATGETTRDFATQRLLEPMRIDVDAWEQDPQGYYFGGNAMYFTPEEMAVLGWLYLSDGRLNNAQIIPSDWVTLTLSPSTDLTHPNQWGEFRNYNYAYLWWLGEIGGYSMFMAYGYGGQFVVVFPGLNLAVVSTARGEVDPDTSTVQEWFIFDLIADYIVPASAG